MLVRVLIGAAAIVVVGISVASAATSCDDVRSDLTGKNLFGEHTMQDLSAQTRAGNCDAAAYLTRRARDAQGYLSDHCPNEADLRSLAGDMVKLGQSVLSTPDCEN